MTYSVGGTIEAADYNGFVSSNAANVNGIWGTGATSYGYGQSTTLANVSTAATISATNWASLVNLLSNIGAHQGTTITSRTAPVAGNVISILANVSADITTLTTNRGNAAASGTDITTNGTTTTANSWSISATASQTVTFSTADNARYFFNGGGMIRLSWAMANASGSAATEWADTLSKSGTIALTGGVATQTIAGVTYTGTTKIGGSGTPDILASTTGYYDLTPGGAATNIFKQFSDTAPYTAAYINLAVALNASSNVLTFTTTLVDAGGLGPVSGNLSQTMVIRPPSTTYLTNTWGTPSMNAASWTTSNGTFATYVANSEGTSSASTSLVVNKPTGTVEGDIMVAFVASSNGATEFTWTGPGGWTELFDEAVTILNGPDLAAYYKIANASEGANYTWTSNAASTAKGQIATYRGATYGGYIWSKSGIFSTTTTYEGATIVPNSTVLFGAAAIGTARPFTANSNISGLYSNVVVSTAVAPSMTIKDQQYANTYANISVSVATGSTTGSASNAVFVVLIPTG